MFSQPPFSPAPASAGPASAERRLDVIIPTRNRSDRLERCLVALAAGRSGDFRVLVADSSSGAEADRVRALCRGYDFVDLVAHDRVGAAAARNVGTEASAAELIVSLDDDVYVEPDAIEQLVHAYDSRGGGDRVVAGSVRWSHWTSGPLVMRWIGHGRDAEPGEEVEFVVSALVLYPRELAIAAPWNERLWPYDDRFASLAWRLAGAELAFAANARADHDERHTHYPVGHEADRIYGNLFDAVFVTRSARRLVSFELLGFAACVKTWWRTPRELPGLVWAWIRGNAAFARDLSRLRNAARKARAYAGRGVSAES